MKKKAADKNLNVEYYNTLVKPLVTEKSSMVGSAGSVITFKVSSRATKTSIKEAVENIFDVNVIKVRTCNYLGKTKRTQRGVGRRASYKKAYITLKEGQSIGVVEGL